MSVDDAEIPPFIQIGPLHPGVDAGRGDIRRALQRHKLQRSSLLHLLDLKRAGHSPRRTEFKIGHDREVPLRYRPDAQMSLLGSSASLTADEGGKQYDRSWR